MTPEQLKAIIERREDALEFCDRLRYAAMGDPPGSDRRLAWEHLVTVLADMRALLWDAVRGK